MNKKFILFIVLFFIVLVFAGVLIYIFKFKTSETDNISLNTREFLIKAKDVTTNKLVVTNFTIMSNGSKIFEGITNSDGYEKILVPNDIQMLEIFSQNNNYYTDFQGKIGNSGELDLRPIGNISVVHVGKLNSTQGNIRVYVDTSYENRELSFCLAWSQSIIKVENNIYSETILLNTEYDCKINNKNWIKEEKICGFWCDIGFKDEIIINGYCDVNQTKILPPTFFTSRIDKCYYSKKTITRDDSLIFDLEYSAYNTISERDFIELYIFDSNKDLNNIYQFESREGKDWGANTIKYTIK